MNDVHNEKGTNKSLSLFFKSPFIVSAVIIIISSILLYFTFTFDHPCSPYFYATATVSGAPEVQFEPLSSLLWSKHASITLNDGQPCSLFGSGCYEIIIDDEKFHDYFVNAKKHFIPHSDVKTLRHSKPVPIFSNFGIETQVQSVYRRKITLPSGVSDNSTEILSLFSTALILPETI